MVHSPGDPFQILLVAALPRLSAFAEALCGNRDRALDLVQSTALKAWQSRSSYDPGKPLLPWLLTILRNTYYTEQRSRRKEVEDVDGEMASRISVAPPQDVSVDVGDVSRMLMTLPPDQREALLLVAAEEFSYEEAAEICKCNLGTIKSRINRARERLAAETISRRATTKSVFAPIPDPLARRRRARA